MGIYKKDGVGEAAKRADARAHGGAERPGEAARDGSAGGPEGHLEGLSFGDAAAGADGGL